MSKPCRLYSTSRAGQQILMFTTVAARRRFLVTQREKAMRSKQQLLYKGTEYLRIYSNCVLYQEYDIKARPSIVDVKAQAERFFKHG